MKIAQSDKYSIGKRLFWEWTVFAFTLGMSVTAAIMFLVIVVIT